MTEQGGSRSQGEDSLVEVEDERLHVSVEGRVQ